MPDMYDKLGDLLNEALESGKITQNTSAQADDIQDRDTSDFNCDKSGPFLFNENKNEKDLERTKKRIKIPQKPSENKAEVIKMHKYTEIMHFPPQIQQILTTLDIVYPYTKENINKTYRILLKQNHPDTKNTIQNSKNVKNIRQFSIDELKYMYNILDTYFNLQ